MLKGIITSDIDGKITNHLIGDCDMLFVVGIKEVDKEEKGSGYAIQNMTIGGGKTDHMLACLAEAIISQLEQMGQNNPAVVIEIMQMFMECITKNANECMYCNFQKIMTEGNANKDGN